MKKDMRKGLLTEIRRQLIHGSGVLTIPIVLYLGYDIGRVFLGFLFLALLAGSFYRRYAGRLKVLEDKTVRHMRAKVESEIKKYERAREFPMKGAVMFYLGVFLTSLLFQLDSLIAAIAVLALGDSVSTLVGKFHGAHRFFLNERKSLEGSAAFFLISLGALLFLAAPHKAVFIAGAAALVETAPWIDDNLSVPLAVGFLFTVL